MHDNDDYASCQARQASGYAWGGPGDGPKGKPQEGAKIDETNRDPQSRHYDHGGIETLDIIRAKLTPEQYQGFLLGNVIKYSCRANFKGNFERDMEKAGFYNRFLREAANGQS